MAGNDALRGRPGDLVGTIRHRLLVNRLADPAEVAPRLPDGLRPLAGPSGGVIVGCCLIVIESARPWPLPGLIGPTIRAAAHRIAVEVGPGDDPTRAVYVPLRHTDSIPTVALGGRAFPGVYRRAVIESAATDDLVRWSVRSAGKVDDAFSIEVSALRTDPAVIGSTTSGSATSNEVADIVIGTRLGLSPDHRGRLEAVEMIPHDKSAIEVQATDLRSDFLDGFATATEAETLLMTDVGVTWRRIEPPIETDLNQRAAGLVEQVGPLPTPSSPSAP